MTWDAVSGAWGYRVRYKKTTQPWSAWTYDTVTTNSLALAALPQGTFYHWQVATMCAANGANNSGFASYVVFTTGACNISLNTSQSNVSCYGLSDGSIDLTVSGGSGSYTYAWSDGSTSEDLSSLSAGTYSVTVTDTWGCTASTSVTITQPASAFSVSIQSIGSTTVCAGSSVNLTMSTYASPANTYQWNDANGVISGATSSTYTATASGSYSLTVINPNGCTATSSSIAVTINTPSVPGSLSTSNIQLTKATMNWASVSNAHHYYVRLRAQGASTWQEFYTTSTSLVKSGLTPSTTYLWGVRSACSSDSSSVSAWSSTESFTTLTPCTAPLNATTTSIGLTSATLTWDAVSGAWGYRVRYKKTTQPWSAWTYDTVTTNSLALAALPQGTYYHWQVATMCAANGANNSGFTSYVVFTTLMPCPDPSNLSASNMTDNSVLLSWTGTSAASTYNILYRATGSSNWDTTTINNNFNSTAVTYTLTGLNEGTTYEWKLSTTCVSSGTSSEVSGSNFTTELSCIVPSGLNVSNILLDRATMNWSATSNAHHYDVRLRVQGTSSWLYMGYIFNTSKTKYSLTSGTVYEWQVRGVCSADTSDVSAWTTTQTFTTLAPCTKPTNTNVTNITSNSATLTWNAVSSATAYDVRFKATSQPWGGWIYTYGVSTNQLTKTGLSSSTYYHWQVRAVCGAGNSSGFTSYNTFTTISGSRVTAGDSSLAINLNIFPNPNRGIFKISFISDQINDFEIIISDIYGKLVSKEYKPNFNGIYDKNVDMSNWPKGVYLIKIKTEDSFVSKRIVLQ